MSGNTYWNPKIDPDKSGGLRNYERPEHVRAEGRRCPVKASRTRLGDRICLFFSSKLD
jgi:hypothetical protein